MKCKPSCGSFTLRFFYWERLSYGWPNSPAMIAVSPGHRDFNPYLGLTQKFKGVWEACNLLCRPLRCRIKSWVFLHDKQFLTHHTHTTHHTGCTEEKRTHQKLGVNALEWRKWLHHLHSRGKEGVLHSTRKRLAKHLNQWTVTTALNAVIDSEHVACR